MELAWDFDSFLYFLVVLEALAAVVIQHSLQSHKIPFFLFYTDRQRTTQT